MNVESDNRSQAFTDFTTKNAHVFNHSSDRLPRSERQANAASGKTPREKSRPPSTPLTAAGVGTGTPLKGNDRITVCSDFMEGICQQGTTCPHPHQRIKVPSAACSKWLADETSCDHSCNKLHESWEVLIEKINSGEISSSRNKTKVAVTRAAIAPGAGASAPPVAGSDSSSGCERCGQANHIKSQCYAKFHVSGARLLSAKTVPVPPDVAAERKARWEAKQEATLEAADQNWDEEADDESEAYDSDSTKSPQANVSQQPGMPKGAVHCVEFATEMARYRKHADHGNGAHIPQINMMEGKTSSNTDGPTKETAPSSSTDTSVRGTTSTSDSLTEVKVVDHSKKTSYLSGEHTNEINTFGGFVVAISPL